MLHPHRADSKLAQSLVRVRGSHSSHDGTDENDELWSGDNPCSKGYRVGGISVSSFRRRASTAPGLSSASHPGGFSSLPSHPGPCLFQGRFAEGCARRHSAPFDRGLSWPTFFYPYPQTWSLTFPAFFHPNLRCLVWLIDLVPWDGSTTQSSNQGCRIVWNNPIEKQWVSNSITTWWQQKLLPRKLRQI